MPMFDPITPVRKGGKTYLPGGDPVELDDTTGAELVALLAVSPASTKSAASSSAKPAAAPSMAQAKKLGQMNKAELLALAKAEQVEVASDASNKAIVAAIEAKRAAPPPAKPLTAMNRDELMTVVETEGVEVADHADDAAIVAAIEAKRGPAA